jgi:hypothetical protein
MTGSFKNFYTYKGVDRWVPLTLTFYIKDHEKKTNKWSLVANREPKKIIGFIFF